MLFEDDTFLPSPSWRSNPIKEEDKNHHEKSK